MVPRGLARPLLLLGALTLAGLLAFGACGGEEEKGATPTVARSPSGSPIDISAVSELKDGKLTIGSDIAYAPIEYYEEGTKNATGMDVDLAKAMAGLLGAQVEFQQVADFAGIVGDLEAKRYDIVMSAISITPERSAKIDFIPYFGPVGTGIVTKKGNPLGFTKVEDLCGHKVAAQKGTYQVDQVTALNEGACKSKPIDLSTFPENPTAVQELILGRVDAELADDPVAAYSALQSTEKLVELAVPGFEAAPYGIGVRKDSPKLKAVLEQALQKIRADGTYAQILKKWGQEEFALQQ